MKTFLLGDIQLVNILEEFFPPFYFILFIYFLTSLLEYNCFTMVC